MQHLLSGMMYRSIFTISKMDCPCEENLIRLKLEGEQEFILNLDFDLAKRTLTIIHKGDIEHIEKLLEELKLGSKRISTSLHEQGRFKTPTTESIAQKNAETHLQRKVLWWVLAINFAFFIIEASSGIISKSMGLLADSLDMLADALVYGMSLMVVGSTIFRKKKVAKLSGYIQILLALWGLVEVIRRFLGLDTPPNFLIMIAISFTALIANSICLWLLQRTKSKDAHIQASVIFSANDVIINLGVITAGLFVWWFSSNIPDLIIGIIVFLIVIRGAIRILKLSK